MNKIKYFVLGATLLVCFSTMAQFTYGPKVGLNMANQSGADVINNKMLIGYNVGILGNYSFGEMISVQAEVLYDTKGAKFEITDETGNKNDINSNLNYINIPIMAKASFGDDVKFFGEIGPSIGMLMNAKLDGKSDTIMYEVDPDNPGQLKQTEIEYKDLFKGTDIGLVLGAGILLPAGKMTLMIDVRYNISLATIGGDIEVPTEYDPISGEFTVETQTKEIKNNVFSISVALIFGGP